MPEVKSMDKPKKSKRYVMVTEVISILLFLISIALIIVCGLLKDHGYGDFWWPTVGLIGFFSCDFLAIFLLFRIMKDAISYEVDKKSKKYDAMGLFQLNNMILKNVNKNLFAHNFKDTGSGYLRKKVFSFSKDAICYYAKCVSSLDLKKTVEYELNSMDTLNEKSKNVCLILFVYKSNINESDLNQLRNISKSFIINETVLPVSSCYTSIIVMIDSGTNEGKFLDLNNKLSISVYAHGCRLIKKYFSI